jgi:hypothetical protein
MKLSILRSKVTTSEPKTRSPLQTLINTILFQLMWFSTIKLASLDLELIATLPGLIIGGYFVNQQSVSISHRIKLKWGISGIILGIVVEGCFINIGLFHPISPPYLILPLWLLSLWFSLFTLLPLELGKILFSPTKSTIFGLLGAPISYVSGANLGAMNLGDNFGQVIGLTGFGWGVTMYLCSRIWLRTQGKPIN